MPNTKPTTSQPHRNFVSPQTRAILEDFYTRYCIALDDNDLDAWPEFFTSTCLYRVTARENWDAGLPLSAILCQSKGMLKDRAESIRKTMMFAPRYSRRFFSALQIEHVSDEEFHTRSNFISVRTLSDEPSQLALCGIAYDKITIKSGSPHFLERTCVLDTEMISNSLIYPL